MNVKNFGVATGRLVKDVFFRANEDGSRWASVRLAVRDNFKTKGEIMSQFIDIETYIPKSDKKAPYDYIHKGDDVSIVYSLRNKNYTDKNGEKVYSTVAYAESITMNESKEVTRARKMVNDAKAQTEKEEVQNADDTTEYDELFASEEEVPF